MRVLHTRALCTAETSLGYSPTSEQLVSSNIRTASGRQLARSISLLDCRICRPGGCRFPHGAWCSGITRISGTVTTFSSLSSRAFPSLYFGEFQGKAYHCSLHLLGPRREGSQRSLRCWTKQPGGEIKCKRVTMHNANVLVVAGRNTIRWL